MGSVKIMQLSDVAAPILCSHALHGKESVMACRSSLFLFHGTSLLAVWRW
jgi:hypothetical protein